MTQQDISEQTAGSEPDHAGSLLCRLLAQAREVGDVEVLGQEEQPGATIIYALGVKLPGNRELYIEVQDI
jgi:hypothetical protein